MHKKVILPPVGRPGGPNGPGGGGGGGGPGGCGGPGGSGGCGGPGLPLTRVMARLRGRNVTGLRADDELTGVRVQAPALAGRCGQDRGVGPGDHRHPEAACDDRRVRARATSHRNRAHQPHLGQLDQVGRAHLAADQDEVTGRTRGGPGLAEAIQDGVRDLPDVAGPLGHLGDGQRLEDRGLRLGGLPHGRGDITAVADGSHGRACEQRVGRDQPPHLDDARFLIAPGGTQSFRQREPFRGHRRERLPRPPRVSR